MKEPHQYKRRTFDEAQKLAEFAFRTSARAHLSEDELEEVRQCASQSGGTNSKGWTSVLGYEPEQRMHYEYRIYKPSTKHPYIEKYFTRILVPRDRSSDATWIMWKPPVEEYPDYQEPPLAEPPDGWVRLHD